jgi:holo-[acyl-carrier protein] synthase
MRIGIYLARLEETPPAESSIFTDIERRYCLDRRYPGPHLAGRYAAKRATCSALALAPDTDLAEIEVRREPGRAPTIALRGEPAQAAQRLGTGEFHLSISHSGDYAVAFVVSE